MGGGGRISGIFGSMKQFLMNGDNIKKGLKGMASGAGFAASAFIDLNTAFLKLSVTMVESVNDAMLSVVDYFGKMVTSALDFDLSIEGLLEGAEKTRKYFSELADDMNFYSSSTGSTKKAMGMLFEATGKSTAGINTLRGAFSSMVDAGADSDQFIKDMLPTLGDFETKTGVGAQQFALLSTKFHQMFGEKKGITKDIKDLQKALIGTGLKGAQLEQTMQGLTEAAEKLGFATQGATLNIKELSKSYGKTTAVFKAFGINAQTTSNFLNNLVDPENVEKNMLLMNKMGISYQEFNDMLNSGQGQDKFFDKILNNVGKVAQEANLIQDASTRYKYLKDTLGLPPEIANKLMKVTPSRMQSELRRIKREMEDAEKKDKWRKDLKAKEEKYEETLSFLRMQMLTPLIGIINKNRDSIMRIMKNLTPIVNAFSGKIAVMLDKFADWFAGVADDVQLLASGKLDFKTFMKDNVGKFVDVFSEQLKYLSENPEVAKFGEKLIEGLMSGMGAGLTKWGKSIPGDVLNLFKKSTGIVIDQLPEKSRGPLNHFRDTGMLGAEATNETLQALLDHFAPNNYENRDLKDDAVESAKENKFADAQNTKLKNMGFGGQSNFFGFGDIDKNALKELEEVLATGDEEKIAKQMKAFGEFLRENRSTSKDKVDKYLNELGDTVYKTKNQKDQEIEERRRQVRADRGEITTPSFNASPKTQEEIKTVLDPKLTDAEVAAAVQKLMNNKDFVSTVTTSLVTVKDKKITDLEKEVGGFAEREKKLREEFESLKNDSTVGILKQWESFLFGEQEDSIKNILLNIDDTLADEAKTKKNITRSASGGAKFAELSALTQNMSLSGSIVGAAPNKLIGAASGANVKNIQVKQTMFLKSIADSTHDSAMVLRYIGKNLTFTSEGLSVNTSGGSTDIYDFGGTKVEKKSDQAVKYSGFTLLKQEKTEN